MKVEFQRVTECILILTAAAGLLLLTGCQRKPQPATTLAPKTEQPADPEWNNFVAQFETEFFKLEPAFAVGEGKHEFDGQLPDWTAQGIKQEIDWLGAERAKAAEFPEA